MATEQSNIELKVTTSGLEEANASAQKLHDALKAALDVAESIHVPSAVQSAREQVAYTNQTRRPRAVAAAAAPEGTMEGTDYRNVRGIAGTGAEGRDFARQAQGLGGLVHVYATFAANLFAVSAAFNALSKAADTTNMIKGLDQLGASSGRALGGVAKQMVEATNGALSLREAMTSTALASAAGMTNAAMLRMTEVAKKASLALGRDMGDSMDRLTKGIAKVQPELLDELGIMTRVIPAQEKYAREVGKSVDALTDFEKKQAFANAVLEEGEKKFSSITIDTNPYTQLSASLANVAQSGLEVVNKVLGPLAESLAKSPTGLGLALAGVAGILLKQAIPALGQYRKGLEAVNAQNLAKVASLSAVVGEAGHDYDIKIAGERAKQKYLAEKEYYTKSADEQKAIMAEAEKRADKAAQASADRATSALGHETNLNRIRDRMYQEAAVSGAKYSVSQIQGAYGMTAAFAQLGDEIKKLRAGEAMIDVGGGLQRQVPQIGVFRTSLLAVTTTVGILGSAIGTIVNALQPWILAFTAIGAGVAFLIDSFRTATKEVDAVGRAFDGVIQAGKTIGDTLDAIAKKPFLEQISNASVQAKATALNELSSSLVLLGKRYQEGQSKLDQGGFADKFANARFMNVLGKFVTGQSISVADRNNLAKQMADGIEEAIVKTSKLVEGGPSEKAFKDAIKGILGVTYKDIGDLEQQLGRMPDTMLAKQPQLVKAFEGISRAVNNAASAGKELEDAWTAANKTYDTILTTLAVTDPLGKLGDESIKVGIAMTKAFEDSDNRLAALSATAKDFSRLRFLDPATAKEMLQFAQNAETAQKNIDKLNEKLKVSKANEAAAATAVKTSTSSFDVMGNFTGSTETASINQARLDAAQQESKNIEKQIAAQKKTLDDQNLYLKVQDEIFAKGASLMAVSISQSFGKAATTLSQALVANTGNTTEGLRRQAELQKQTIDIETKNLQGMLTLAKATNELAKIQEELLIQEKKKELDTQRAEKKISGPEYATKYTELAVRRESLVASRDESRMNMSTALKDLKGDDAVLKGAAQRNWPLIAMTEQLNAQVALNEAKKKGIDLETKFKEIQLDTQNLVKLLDLDNKRLASKQAFLLLTVQASEYENTYALTAKHSLEESIALNNEQKERLNILTQIRDGEQRLRTKGISAADRVALEKSVARYRIDLAQFEQKASEDKAIRDAKATQEMKLANIAELNYLKDQQLLYNTINNERLAGIQNIAGGYLDFVNQEKLDVELSNLQLNYDKEAYKLAQNRLVLEENLNTLLSNKADPVAIQGAEKSLAENRAKQAQNELRFQTQSANINASYLKTRLEGLESIRKLNDDIYSAEKRNLLDIQQVRIDTELKIIQAKQSLGYISPETAARQIAAASQRALANTIETQKVENEKEGRALVSFASTRTQLLLSAYDAINKEFDNRAQEQLSKSQSAVDKINKAPTLIPGELEPAEGAMTAEVKETQLFELKKAHETELAEIEKQRQDRLRETATLSDTLVRAEIAKLIDKKNLQDETNKQKDLEIGLTKQISVEQAKYAQIAKDQAFYSAQAEQAAKSLTAVFGDFGKSLGEVVTGLAKTAQDMATYEQDRIKALQQIEAAKDNPEEQKLAYQNLTNLDNKYNAQRLDGLAQAAKGASSFFDANSKGYKALMVLEKTIHLIKLADMAIAQAIWIKDWIVRMTATRAEAAASGTAGAARTGGSFLGSMGGSAAGSAAGSALGSGGAAAGEAAFTETTSTGLATVAGEGATAAPAATGAGLGASLMAAAPYIAAAAVAVALLSKSDKPSGPTPEQLASVSGTGLRYNAAGGLEYRGTGALGDAKAANEGIQKSIDYLGKINYESLQFDKNKALVALEAIRLNTSNFVKMLGPTGQLGDITAGGTVTGSSSGFLGFNKSSVSLAASGVEIVGTIGEIADNMGGVLRKFEDIRRTSSSWWGLRSSESIDRNYSEIAESAKKFIRVTVGSFREAIQAVAPSFGKDGGLLKPIIDQIDISFTAYKTGETGAEFAARVQQELGNKLDEAILSVFPTVQGLADKFQNLGETLTQFVMRVQSDSEQLKFAFQSIGQTYIDTTGGDSAGAMIQREAEQTLIQAFGGAQELFSTIDKYGNSMLTEAQRLAPVRENVNKKLVELFPQLEYGGKTLITTREQFDDLRKSLDPLDPATQDLWIQMTKLGPAFASVTEQTVKLTEAELKKAQMDQYSTILNLKGDDLSKAKALAIARQRELDGMDALLKPTQLYIYALQDEAAAKDKLQTSYDKVKSAINGTVDSLKNQISTLQEYKKNLQMGDKSNLTPQEAYAAAKGQLESAGALAQQALGPEASKEQVAARDKAVASLPSLIDQFLAQSKTSYASGEQYQADYSWVNSLLDTTTAQLDSQETDAEKQLNAINESVSYLTTIDESSKTTATLMAEFLANQKTYEDAAANASSLLTTELTDILSTLTTKVTPDRGFASGGLAGPGMHLVGEQGPELVDFANPGRVYTSGQTASFGDNSALIAELKALRDEVCQLRTDQKEQTGHIIQSNYDANNRNAQAVSTVTENAIKQQTWKERSQVVIA